MCQQFELGVRNVKVLVVGDYLLSTPVVPFFPVYFGVSLLELNIRKKGTLIIKGLLENLAWHPLGGPPTL